MTDAINKRRVLGNAVSLMVVQVAGYALPLISMPVIARIIGPGKLGVLDYAFAFISYFSLLISFGFDFTATRRIARDPGNVSLRNDVFREVLQAQLLLFIISVLLFAGCLYLVPPLALEKKVAVFSFFTCLATLLTQNWLFQAMQDLPRVAALNVLGKLLFTMVVLFIVRSPEDYVWQPLLLSLANVLVAVVSFIWAIRRYRLKPALVPFRRILQLLREERSVFFSLAVISLYTTTNTVMLGLLSDSVSVGYYTAAQKLIVVVTTIINLPLSQAFYPVFGQAFSESREKGVAAIQKIVPLICIFVLIMGLGLFLLGPAALHWFYGSAFDPSIPAFRVMAFVPALIACSNVLGIQVMLNLKMDKLFFRITATGALLGLCLNFFMTKYMDYMGTAWNWLIVELYITAVMFVALRMKGIHLLDRQQFRPAAILAQLKPLTGKWLKRDE